MFRLLKNPLYIYLAGFTLSLVIYQLGWSNLYPKLRGAIFIFFSITFVFFGLFGLLARYLGRIKSTYSKTEPKLIKYCAYSLFLLYSVEFTIEGDVPLFAKLTGRSGVGYMEFGLPLLHGILISFNSFLIAHTFSTYMATKRKSLFRLYLLLFVPALLFLSRSILMLGILTSIFIYIHYSNRVTFKNQLKLGLLAIVSLYLFGVLGNLRSGGDYIYQQSKATKEFMNSDVPKEFYWTYLYTASPLANFQNTVNTKYILEKDYKGFVFYENLPQIISKNLGRSLNIEKKDLNRIAPWLTVGTTYAKSYSYLGWQGPYLLFIANLLIYLLVLFFLVPTKSSYHITTISVLSVIILLNIFTNMLIVTGISFQLVYCVLFSFFERKKIVLRE